MQVRTFRARSLEEALGLVQRELGPDAQVLQARELDTSWWERFSRGRHYEIRTREQSAGPLPLRKSGSLDRDGASEPPTLDAGRLARFAEYSPGLGSAGHDDSGRRHGIDAEGDDLDRLSRELGSSEERRPERPAADSPRTPFFSDGLSHVSEAHAASDQPDPFEFGGPAKSGRNISPFRRPQSSYSVRVLEVISRLIEADVTPHAARDLVDAVREAGADDSGWTMADWQMALIGQLHAELPRGGELRITPGHRKVITVVGPTGTGKTTTIAKLAARWRLEQQLKVALVSVDTYRVAAVEQLRTYADILGVPLEVVTTPREMQTAIARLSDQDVVLVDTAGRSSHDSLQLQELRSLVTETRAEDVLLVLSGSSSASHHRLAVHRFLDVGVTGIVVTKLDEATSLGSMLPVLRETRLPVHYLTCGQNVPEDLATADLQRLVPALRVLDPLDHVA